MSDVTATGYDDRFPTEDPPTIRGRTQQEAAEPVEREIYLDADCVYRYR